MAYSMCQWLPRDCFNNPNRLVDYMIIFTDQNSLHGSVDTKVFWTSRESFQDLIEAICNKISPEMKMSSLYYYCPTTAEKSDTGKLKKVSEANNINLSELCGTVLMIHDNGVRGLIWRIAITRS